MSGGDCDMRGGGWERRRGRLGDDGWEVERLMVGS